MYTLGRMTAAFKRAPQVSMARVELRFPGLLEAIAKDHLVSCLQSQMRLFSCNARLWIAYALKLGASRKPRASPLLRACQTLTDDSPRTMLGIESPRYLADLSLLWKQRSFSTGTPLQ